jgi:hypothetical protein
VLELPFKAQWSNISFCSGKILFCLQFRVLISCHLAREAELALLSGVM